MQLVGMDRAAHSCAKSAVLDVDYIHQSTELLKKEYGGIDKSGR